MKRYLCTLAAGFALALTGTATATANDGLPIPGQSASQEAVFGEQKAYGGDQDAEAENEADVTNKQVAGNVLSPQVAVAVHGDAENEQNNVNYSDTDVKQENEVEQEQSSSQQSGGSSCCNGQSQAGEQKAYGGDQDAEAENEADVTNKQVAGNVLSPQVAVAVHGDAENEQNNVNYSDTDVKQENEVEQEQSSSQQSGGSSCCNGQSQAGEQKAYGGDQDAEAENEADVTNKQVAGNVLSPQVAVAVHGDAENEQNNVNYSDTDVKQENEVEQEQSSSQQSGGSSCCNGQSQAGEQKAYGGDQDAEAENEADVTNKQVAGNVLSPQVALGLGGDAENEQNNVNVSKTEIEQENEVEQKQSSEQKQYGSGCCKPAPTCSNSCTPQKRHYDTPARTKEYEHKGACCAGGEQKAYGGDQDAEAENEADVTNKQVAGNVLSPQVALGLGGDAENEQNNVNVSKTEIEQENEVEQKQSSEQKQYGSGCCKPAPTCSNSCTPQKRHYDTPARTKEYEHKGACCAGGEQKAYGGDQDAEAENEADVTNKQVAGNVLSPQVALGLGGDAENEQNNVNVSKTEIEQENEVEQKQSSEQKQYGSGCCKPAPTCSNSCTPQKRHYDTPARTKEYEHKGACCAGGEQKAYGGDQDAEAENEADVTNKQVAGNVLSPQVALGLGGDAENEQNNVNVSKTEIEQENEVEQKQSSYQHQTLVDRCKGLINR